MPLITRIAPTPSGRLHTGNAYNFILTWLYCRKKDGILWLRIDDHDAARCRPEYIDDIFASLEWLGLDWDRGPFSSDQFSREFSQAARTDYYRRQLSRISEQELFACDCSRNLVRQTSADGGYTGRCRNRGLEKFSAGTALRLNCPDLPPGIRDFIVWRKDDLPAYQLVSTVDDHDMQVNTIIRGADLYESTLAQKRLASHLSFDFNEVQWFHHGLLTENGQKLSKSDGATSLNQIRRHSSVADLLTGFCRFFSLPPAASLDELRSMPVKTVENLIRQYGQAPDGQC